MENDTTENDDAAKQRTRAEMLDHVGRILARRQEELEEETRLYHEALRRLRQAGAAGEAAGADGAPAHDTHVVELHLSAEEYDVWSKAAARYRREIDPRLTETQCLELVLREFVRRHG